MVGKKIKFPELDVLPIKRGGDTFRRRGARVITMYLRGSRLMRGGGPCLFLGLTLHVYIHCVLFYV